MLDDVKGDDIIAEWNEFVYEQREKELEELIRAEKLKPEPTRGFFAKPKDKRELFIVSRKQSVQLKVQENNYQSTLMAAEARECFGDGEDK